MLKTFLFLCCICFWNVSHSLSKYFKAMAERIKIVYVPSWKFFHNMQQTVLCRGMMAEEVLPVVLNHHLIIEVQSTKIKYSQSQQTYMHQFTGASLRHHIDQWEICKSAIMSPWAVIAAKLYEIHTTPVPSLSSSLLKPTGQSLDRDSQWSIEYVHCTLFSLHGPILVVSARNTLRNNRNTWFRPVSPSFARFRLSYLPALSLELGLALVVGMIRKV